MGGNAEIYQRILWSYMNSAPGIAAQFEAALAASDMANCAIIAHGLKSSSLSIGAADVGETAHTLECAAKAGDAAIVRANASVFLGQIETLVAALEQALA
jgi:HPt (histidine-containing phosphotransfer) domain-containing protein